MYESVDEANAILALRDPFRGSAGKIDSSMIFQISRDLKSVAGPSASLQKSWIYYSRLRPIPAGVPIDGATAINDRWLYSPLPISPEVIIRRDLQPVQLSLARFVFEVSAATGTPVELTDSAMVEPGFSVEVLFFSPSNLWQLSHFVDGVGPTGHVEAHTPEELLMEAIYGRKRRFWVPGLADLAVENIA